MTNAQNLDSNRLLEKVNIRHTMLSNSSMLVSNGSMLSNGSLLTKVNIRHMLLSNSSILTITGTRDAMGLPTRGITPLMSYGLLQVIENEIYNDILSSMVVVRCTVEDEITVFTEGWIA